MAHRSFARVSAFLALFIFVSIVSFQIVAPTTALAATSYGNAGQFSSGQAWGVGVATTTGNVYVANTANNILIFTATGTAIGSFGGTGSGNGQLNQPEAVAVDALGNIYVADYNNNRVEVFSSTTAYVSQFGGSGSGNGQFNAPDGIAISPITGNIYVSDSRNNRVQIFSSTSTYIGQFGSHGSGNGQFDSPGTLAIDSAGNIYVADYNNSRVEKFASTTAYVSSIGSFGSGNGQLMFPVAVALDASGNLYVADTGNNRVEVFNSAGSFQATYGGFGSGSGQFNTPSGIAVNPSTGMGYVADLFNSRVDMFAPVVVPTVVGSAATSVSTSSVTFNGAITATGYSSITDAGFAYSTTSDLTSGVATTSVGAQSGAVAFTLPVTGLYPGTTYYYRAYAVNSAGTSTGSILSATMLPLYNYVNQWSGTGSIGFGYVVSVTVSSSTGNVYVFDNSHNNIQEFTPMGSFIRSWGSLGSGNGQFHVTGSASTIAFSPVNGYIYVADTGNNRIQVFTQDGTYVTSWGSSGSGNSQFNNAQGLGVSPVTGNVYVADYGNNRVQEFSPTGVYITQWGSSGSGNGQFNAPNGIAVSPTTGNVYVGDYSNNRIQVFTSSGTYVTQFANGLVSFLEGVAISPVTGNVFVVSAGDSHVLEFTSSGAYVGQFGSSGSGNGKLGFPFSLAVSPFNNNIYIPDPNNGRVEVFSTPFSLPDVTTTGSTNITFNGASVSGSIVFSGTGNLTAAGFVYGLTTAYGATVVVTNSPSVGGYSAQLLSLTCGTTYHVAAYAANANGVGYGTDKTFTTNTCPAVSSAQGGTASLAQLASLLAPSPAANAYLASRGYQVSGQSVSQISTTANSTATTTVVATSTINHVSSTVFTRDLSVGSVGADVLALQKFLNTHGYVIAHSGLGSSGNETNKFGAMTRVALAKFQKAHGISPAAGNFGPMTRGYVIGL